MRVNWKRLRLVQKAELFLARSVIHCADNARTPLNVIGEVTLPLALGGKPLPNNAFVSPDVPELMFGS